MTRRLIVVMVCLCAAAIAVAQTRRRPRTARPQAQTQTQRDAAAKYSAFLHSSDKHKSLACNACHKIPTAWNAKRDFPDVADFPDHDACVRCHRPQFFSSQAMRGTGPTICTVCHLRAAPREAARFAFGKPNDANETAKAKDERQFTIEFPHDKHQNVIVRLRRAQDRGSFARLLPLPMGEGWGEGLRNKPSPLAPLPTGEGNRIPLMNASFDTRVPDDQKPDYNNCTICHQRNDQLISAQRSATADPNDQSRKFFKTVPHSHDACFDCHWKNQKPVSDDCGACHKQSNTFVAPTTPERITAKFSHEGGKGGHVMECTTCHINITRAATTRGLTPDVPIAACTTCHKDNKKTTYPNVVTIEEEFAANKKTGECTYCHAPDVGKKKPPPSHEAAAQ